MFTDWFTASWESLAAIVLSALGVYFVVLIYTRLAGLRSFSQMSGFDFAVNIAVGSILASTAASQDVSLIQGTVAIGTLFLVQMLIARIRRAGVATDWVNNRSLLLMDGSEFIEEHLHSCQITTNDLRFKLREANVFRYDQVRAVVMETTGEITVLHAHDDAEIDADILADVIGAERLAEQTQPPEEGTDPAR